MTSFATELAVPTVTDERTDTLPRLRYKDVENSGIKAYEHTLSWQ